MKPTYKQLAMAVSLATLISTSAVTLAQDEHNVVPGLTAVGAPLGLHGIDPVAFIQIGNRIEGAARFSAVHDGVAYYFSSDDNKRVFEQSPARYTPQNGGFCTYGVSVGKKFDGNPQYADVVDGKLYVFLSEDIFKAYQQNKAGTITKAKAQWSKIRSKSAVSL